MNSCYLTYAKRTPIGKFGGSLAHVRIDDLMATLLIELRKSLTFDPLEIDDVIVGCSNQAGEDNRNLARMALLLADFPVEVPGVTVNRLCGSSLDALGYAYAKITAGMGDCFVVGGAEGMSRAPYVLSKSTVPFQREQKMWDTSMGLRFPNPELKKRFGLLSMGETAEEVARKFHITREQQDLFAFNSHQKALQAQETQFYKEEILPVQILINKSLTTVNKDEGPRKDCTLNKLSQLRPAFIEKGTVTAGNSSSLNDGAAVLMVVSESFLNKHHLSPLIQMKGIEIKGLHPNIMGLGPVEATTKLCQKHGLKTNQFDVIELNEAFSAQSLACIKKLEIDPHLVNPKGGAIALGHPLGCSGARIVVSLINQFQKNPELKKGLATMCIGFGQGIAAYFEKC